MNQPPPPQLSIVILCRNGQDFRLNDNAGSGYSVLLTIRPNLLQ